MGPLLCLSCLKRKLWLWATSLKPISGVDPRLSHFIIIIIILRVASVSVGVADDFNVFVLAEILSTCPRTPRISCFWGGCLFPSLVSCSNTDSPLGLNMSSVIVVISYMLFPQTNVQHT